MVGKMTTEELEVLKNLVSAVNRIGDILDHMVVEGLVVMPDSPISDN